MLPPAGHTENNTVLKGLAWYFWEFFAQWEEVKNEKKKNQSKMKSCDHISYICNKIY